MFVVSKWLFAFNLISVVVNGHIIVINLIIPNILIKQLFLQFKFHFHISSDDNNLDSLPIFGSLNSGFICTIPNIIFLYVSQNYITKHFIDCISNKNHVNLDPGLGVYLYSSVLFHKNIPQNSTYEARNNM